jgi:hypothetical protein
VRWSPSSCIAHLRKGVYLVRFDFESDLAVQKPVNAENCFLRNAFWTAQLLKPDVVAVLEDATLDVGELTCLDHFGRSLQGAVTRINGERTTSLAGQLAAATAATAAANTAAAATAVALALASAGGGPAGAGGTRSAADSSYSLVALSGKQSAEADLAPIRVEPAFVAGIRYAANGQWALARAHFARKPSPPNQRRHCQKLHRQKRTVYGATPTSAMIWRLSRHNLATPARSSNWTRYPTGLPRRALGPPPEPHRDPAACRLGV